MQRNKLCPCCFVEIPGSKREERSDFRVTSEQLDH